jgi:membrane protein DedA with SNARE-associated domain
MDHQFLGIVILNTLLHELGVPVPLAPTVLAAGARAAARGTLPLALIAAIIVATLIGNSVWFAVGRRYGSRTLQFLCRATLSPDSCMIRTEQSFRRLGWSSIVVGRFIPGMSLVTPPLAGALGMGWSKFIALSAAGAALWGLVVVSTGMLLHDQLDAAFRMLYALGGKALGVIILLVVSYVAWRWLQQRRAARKRGVRRMEVDKPPTLVHPRQA